MKKLLVLSAMIGFLAGCASFSTNTFRTEQAAVDLVYTAYVGWTNYLIQFPAKVTPQASNDVKQARLKFAATVGTLESWRAAYATNSATQTQVEAALAAVQSDASNIVWLVGFYRGQ